MSYRIAIEAGATRTRAGLYDESMTLVREVEADGANPLELGVDDAGRVLIEVVRNLLGDDVEEVGKIIAGVAGAGKGNFAKELAEVLCRNTGASIVSVSNDTVPMLRANLGDAPGLLVIAGTGSSVLAQDAKGATLLVGGHGAMMGDRGSSYGLGLEALRACSAVAIGTGDDTNLFGAILTKTGSSDIDTLVVWSGGASKGDVAALAKIVIEKAGEGDGVAREIVLVQAKHLADQTVAARDRAGLDHTVSIVTYGGLISQSKIYADAFAEALSTLWPESSPQQATITGHRAVAMSTTNLSEGFITISSTTCGESLPATERMLQSEKPIDRMAGLEITDWMTQSDSTVHGVLRDARESIALAIETAAEAISAGGRIIYVGAGTSGRLGVLDASECPPTFGIAKDRVVGLIAGGDFALRNSVEDAEDDPEQARRDLEGLSPSVSGNDFVVGITASGTTSYVLGALEFARGVGAKTCLMSCNAVSCNAAQQFIVLETGPEVLPGSTRLKAGTATKLALNQITTGAMARCGHIFEGYMVGVKGVNAKLTERTLRIAADLLDVSNEEARAALDAAAGSIKVAVLMHRLGLNQEDANDRLFKTGGHLRDALDL